MMVVSIPLLGLHYFVFHATQARSVGTNAFTVWLTPEDLIGIALCMAYEGLMLQRWGQRLGKMAFRIQVEFDDGQKISTGIAWGRGLSRNLTSVLPILGLLDMLMIFSSSRKTLHDRVCRTRVVKLKR